MRVSGLGEGVPPLLLDALAPGHHHVVHVGNQCVDLREEGKYRNQADSALSFLAACAVENEGEYGDKELANLFLQLCDLKLVICARIVAEIGSHPTKRVLFNHTTPFSTKGLEKSQRELTGTIFVQCENPVYVSVMQPAVEMKLYGVQIDLGSALTCWR